MATRPDPKGENEGGKGKNSQNDDSKLAMDEDNDELRKINLTSFIGENAPKFYSKKKMESQFKGKIEGLLAVEKWKNSDISYFIFKDASSREAAFSEINGQKVTGTGQRLRCRRYELNDLKRKRKRQRDSQRNPAKRRKNAPMVIDGIYEVTQVSENGECILAGAKSDAIHIRDKGKRWVRFTHDGKHLVYDNSFHFQDPKHGTLDVRANTGVQYRDTYKSVVTMPTPGRLVLRVPVNPKSEFRPPLRDDQEEKTCSEFRESILERARDARHVTTPLWRMSYDDQLKFKFLEARMCIKKLARFLSKNYDGKGKKTAMGGGRLCALDPIVPSPLIKDYRNKCEFAIGLDVITGKPLVGSTVFSLKSRVYDGDESLVSGDGQARVADPSLSPHLPRVVIDLTNAITGMIRESKIVEEKFKVYDRIAQTGVFRMLMIRCSLKTREVMIQLQVSNQYLTEEKLTELSKDYLKTCKDCEEKWEESSDRKGFKVVSALLQQHSGKSEIASIESTKLMNILGDGYFHESLLGLRFRVSPGAFFQVNVPSAERLFSTVQNWSRDADKILLQSTKGKAGSARIEEKESKEEQKKDEIDSTKTEEKESKEKPVILDVCCGTGTIGLLLSSTAKHIFGLELVASAIEDAKLNATLNKINNVEYFVGKAEDTIKTVVEKLSSFPPDLPVIAVVDPPRAGLNQKVIRALRNCRRVRHIIYVSCNIRSMMEDLKKFLQPHTKKLCGAPFKVLKCQPFDLFPQTLHFEMLMLLSRSPDSLDRNALRRKAAEASSISTQ